MAIAYIGKPRLMYAGQAVEANKKGAINRKRWQVKLRTQNASAPYQDAFSNFYASKAGLRPDPAVK